MSKTITFNTDNERDKKLLKEIKKYMEENNLKHYVEAVRILCEKIFEIEKIIKK